MKGKKDIVQPFFTLVQRQRFVISLIFACFTLLLVLFFRGGASPPVPEIVPADNSLTVQEYALQVVANRHREKKYEWGDWDCSSFVRVVYSEFFGQEIDRTANEQCESGEVVESPIDGDLVCFDWDGDGRFDHVGIYVGAGHLIHNSVSRGVCVEKLTAAWLNIGNRFFVRVRK
jgi:cell wall-associated NlpC family hydrolase